MIPGAFIVGTFVLVTSTRDVAAQESSGAYSLTGRMDQVQVRLELVMPEQQLIEEFSLTYDRRLNLAKFDYSLDPNVPPYYSLNSRTSIVDYNTDTYYDIDQATGQCNVTFGPIIEFDSKISTHSLLKMLYPISILSTPDFMRWQRKDKHRGMNTNVWSANIARFFIAGYGEKETRQTFHILANTSSKYFRGINQRGIILQRSIQLVENGNIPLTNPPLIMINYFDFYSPKSREEVFDFNVMNCLGAGADRQEVMIKFNGRLPSPSPDSIERFRNAAWREIANAAGISPVRSTINQLSLDDWSTHFSFVLLPRTERVKLFRKVETEKAIVFSGYGSTGDEGIKSVEMGFDHMIEDCADFCLRTNSCQSFAWCPDSSQFQMFACVMQPSMVANSPGTRGRMLEGCSAYQDKVAPKIQEPSTIDAMIQLSDAVTKQTLNVTIGNYSATAYSVRTNVDVVSSLKGAQSFTDDPPEEFVFHRGEAIIIGNAVKFTGHKMSTQNCLQRCKSGDSFICHSAAVCQNGDCVLSDLHGDELIQKRSYISNHTHCAIWSRIWTSDYVRVAPSFFTGIEFYQSDSSSLETCAKKCSFSTGDKTQCESMLWCPGTDRPPQCALYSHHALDEPQAEKSRGLRSCRGYTRDYAKQFDTVFGIALNKMPLGDEQVKQVAMGAFMARWKCATKCIEELGSSCRAAEICDTDGKSGEILCRVSSVAVARDRHVKSSLTVVNDSCSLLIRNVGKTDQAESFSEKALAKCDKNVQICANRDRSYSASEMGGLAFCMLLVGAAAAVAAFFVDKKFRTEKEVPFVRFSAAAES